MGGLASGRSDCTISGDTMRKWFELTDICPSSIKLLVAGAGIAFSFPNIALAGQLSSGGSFTETQAQAGQEGYQRAK